MTNFLSGLLQKHFYPTLLGLSIALWMDIGNRGFLPVEQFVFFCIGYALVCSIVQLILFLIFRNNDIASVSALLLIIWFFSFGSFADQLNNLTGNKSSNTEIIYLIPYLVLGGFFIWVAIKFLNRKLLTRFLNYSFIILVLIGLYEEIPYYQGIENVAAKATQIIHNQVNNLKLEGDCKPNIYYIVLDAAGGPSVLEQIYGLKNNTFIDYLGSKGFYLASKSLSNYDRTMFSFASFLNFTYINEIAEVLPKDLSTLSAFSRLIQDCNAIHYLKKLGYTTVNVASGYPMTEYNPYADKNIFTGPSNTLLIAIAQQWTILRAFEPYTDFLGGLLRSQRKWILNHFEDVKNIKSPKFVLIHLLIPHPPFLFTANGDSLPLDKYQLDESYSIEKYKGQIIYAFTLSRLLIDKILAENKKQPPIIILQGDHGPQMTVHKGWHSPEYLKERFSTFNAYFLPGGKEKCLYDSISPVNTFRVIFNQYFNAQLPLLPDNSYYAPPAPPYSWTHWKNKN